MAAASRVVTVCNKHRALASCVTAFTLTPRGPIRRGPIH